MEPSLVTTQPRAVSRKTIPLSPKPAAVPGTMPDSIRHARPARDPAIERVGEPDPAETGIGPEVHFLPRFGSAASASGEKREGEDRAAGEERSQARGRPAARLHSRGGLVWGRIWWRPEAHAGEHSRASVGEVRYAADWYRGPTRDRLARCPPATCSSPAPVRPD